MDRIRILIADRDKEYTLALARILTNKYAVFHVAAIEFGSCGWKKEDWLDIDKYDLILVDDRTKKELPQFTEKTAEKIVLLTTQKPEEEADVKNRVNGDPAVIYKYGGASRIASELRFRYAHLSGVPPKEVPDLCAELLAFTGAAGGVGKTAVSIAVARELAGYHKMKVLLLSMETPESIDIYLNGEGGERGLSDYLYYLFSKKEQKTASCPEAFLSVDHWGVEFFRPGRSRNELSELSPEQFLIFVSTLCNARKYDCVCLDMDAASSENCFQRMRMMTQIILINDGSPVSMIKNKRFLNDLNLFRKNDDLGSVLQIRNKWINEERFYSENEAENVFVPELQICGDINIAIEYDPESFRQTTYGVELELDRRFGLGVKKLAEEIRRKI